jgi:biopolymer transport protein TolR
MTTGTPNRAEINVTPMIDILLVLLLIFMIITPQLSHGLGARVPTPANETASKEPPRDIVVSVDENRAITINSQTVSWQDLSDRLKQIFARRPDGVLFVTGAPLVEYKDIARVIDTAKGIGIDRVALMPREANSRETRLK